MIEWTFTRRLLVGGALSLFAALYVSSPVRNRAASSARCSSRCRRSSC